MTITVPSPAKVFTLAGAFARPVTAGELRGDLWRPPNTRETLTYTNITRPLVSQATALANVQDAAARVQTALFTWTPNIHVILYGRSMGAQVLYYWLRTFGVEGAIDPTRVTLVCAANPERKYTGICYVDYANHPAIYPGGDYGYGWGLPVDPTPYRVIDIARQYDFFADHPASLGNRRARQNIGDESCPIHRDYKQIGLNDEKNVVSTEGNVTYVTAPTYPLKMLRFSTGRGKEYLMRRDQELRPEIEAAYDRPKAVPMPDYWGMKTGETQQRRTVACTPSRPTFWAKIR